MAESLTLTDHQAIRDWASARAGKPAISTIPTGTGDTRPVLHLLFGQTASRMDDQDDALTDTMEMVEWDEWFAVFEDEQLCLVVPPETPGQVRDDHQLLKR